MGDDGDAAREDAALEAVALVKRYDGRAVVDGLDLRVRPGEIHGLLGANGAGKTTLLRLLLGLATLDAGHVRLFARQAAGTAGSLPEGMSGFVDAPGFYPHLSGRQNLRLLARLDAPPRPARREQRVSDALARVTLTDHADRRFRTYSAGMRQRLAIAAALLREPRLLLLDEPTSSLDPASARDLRQHFRALAAAGTAIVLSSHDMGEVEAICTAVTVLREGRVLFRGSLAELRQQSGGAEYRLRTSDDERARVLSESALGQGTVAWSNEGDGLEVTATGETLDPYILALGSAGIAVRHLERRETTLSSLTDRLASSPQTGPPPPAAARERTSAVFTLARVASVLAVECAKLASLATTRAVIAACAALPFGFALAMKVQTSTPDDTLFGRWVSTSGYAVSLVVLGFASQWVFPVLTCVVAGDLFSSEDRERTWSTLLTRSSSRIEVFLGKAAAAISFSVLVIAVLAAASFAAGTLLIGTQPLIGLSGTEISGAEAVKDVALAWLSILPPALGFTGMAILVSVVTRSGVAGVGLPVLIALLMELLSLVAGADALRRFTLTAPFVGWHGLFVVPRAVTALEQGSLVSFTYAAVCLLTAAVVFTRRDVRG